MPVTLYYRGQALGIWLSPGAEESWAEAEAGVPGNRESCKAQFRARLERLGAFGTLRSPDFMNEEGEGIYAVKATCGLRAYGWFENVEGRKAFVISHVVLKKRQKLDPRDLARAKAEREKCRVERQLQQKGRQ